MRSSGIGGRPPCSLIFGYTVATACVISGHGIMRSMSARNLARRVVLPYFSNPVSVCCFIVVLAVKHDHASEWPVNQSFLREWPRQLPPHSVRKFQFPLDRL